MSVLTRITITAHKITRTCITTSTRNFFNLFRRPTPAKLMALDRIPPHFELIYSNTLRNYMLPAQFLSTFFVVTVAVVAITTDVRQAELSKLDEYMKPAKHIKNEVYVYMTALLTMSVALHAVITRMPLRIYHIPQTKNYVFVYNGTLPFVTKKVECVQGDISKMAETGVLPWKDSRYDVKNHPTIMWEKFFRAPADYSIMMGYQKERYD